MMGIRWFSRRLIALALPLVCGIVSAEPKEENVVGQPSKIATAERARFEALVQQYLPEARQQVEKSIRFGFGSEMGMNEVFRLELALLDPISAQLSAIVEQGLVVARLEREVETCKEQRRCEVVEARHIKAIEDYNFLSQQYMAMKEDKAHAIARWKAVDQVLHEFAERLRAAGFDVESKGSYPEYRLRLYYRANYPGGIDFMIW